MCVPGDIRKESDMVAKSFSLSQEQENVIINAVVAMCNEEVWQP